MICISHYSYGSSLNMGELWGIWLWWHYVLFHIFSFSFLKHPVGGKTAPAVVSVLKKCRFRHSETTDSFSKIGLKIPGNLKSFDDDLQFTEKFLLKRCAVFFSTLTSPCGSSRSDQWPPKGFWFWSSSSKSLVTEPQNVFFRKNDNSFCPRLSHEEALCPPRPQWAHSGSALDPLYFDNPVDHWQLASIFGGPTQWRDVACACDAS